MPAYSDDTTSLDEETMQTAATPVLLSIDFPFDGPWGKDLAAQLAPLAHHIAASSGLKWKLWTENRQTRRAGGIYLFSDQPCAQAYLKEHVTRLQGFGITDIRAEEFEMNDLLNEITASPAGAPGKHGTA